MPADDLPPADDPADDDGLLGALGDLGRRIDAAKADAESRQAAPPPRRFPLAWIAVAVLIALVSGGLLLANGGDDGDEIAAGGPPSTADAAVGGASTTATTGDPGSVASGDPGAATTAAPTTTDAPTSTAAPTTTEAPTTTQAPTTTAPVAPTTTAPPPTTGPPSTAPSTPPAAPAADRPDQTAPAPDVTVQPGDSFWRIAEQQVTQQLGHPPSTAEITTYWAQLVDLNASRLVQPGNPDLVLPGQVLLLPGTG